MQARPNIAKKYAVKAINAALNGVQGDTAIHICFGYAHIVHERPEGYSFCLNSRNARTSLDRDRSVGINLEI